MHRAPRRVGARPERASPTRARRRDARRRAPRPRRARRIADTIPHSRVRRHGLRLRAGSTTAASSCYRRDSAFAWAGDFRAADRPGPRRHDDRRRRPFYLALQVAQRRGDDRASSPCCSMRRLRPTDSSPTLAQPIADRAGLKEFKFFPPSDSAPGPDVLRYPATGTPLFDVSAVPLTQGEVTQQIAEMARARAGIALLVALVCFVIGVWRATRTTSRRAAALAIGLACIGLVPLNQYSNLEPAVRSGRVLHVARRSAHRQRGRAGDDQRGRVARRARGVSPRPAPHVALGCRRHHARRGAARALSAARSVARRSNAAARRRRLALAHLGSAAVSRRGVRAARPARRRERSCSGRAAARRRGSRRSIATAAAVLAPVVWQAPGRWPWWYSILWIVAIGMLALSRRSRARHSQRVDGGRAWRDDARLGTHGARPRRVRRSTI